MEGNVLSCQQMCQPVNHICTLRPPMPSISVLFSTGASMPSEQHVLDSTAPCSTAHVNVFLEICISCAQ